MSLHDGHRERLKKQFLTHGLDTFNDINALELLLFFSIPRRDTNETAHRLLDRFGNLPAVFSASFEELKEVDGVGFSSALLICLVHQLIKKLEVSKTAEIISINNVKEAGKYFIARFVNEPDELLLMVCLDSNRNIISCSELARGTVNSVNVNIRRIAQIALQNRAVSVILAHNHPTGMPLPSVEDDVLTKQIHKILATLDIKLEDHVIVSGKKYCSMAAYGNLLF